MLKYFSFVLSPLSAMQKGVQTTHCAVDLIEKYRSDEQYRPMVSRWVNQDKTLIVLDGGCAQELANILTVIEENDFPYGVFRESAEFLNGIMTAVGVILPECVYKAVRMDDLQAYLYVDPDGKRYIYALGSAVYDLLELKSGCRLAA